MCSVKLPYQFRGKVLHGKQMGRHIGFPTLNLIPDHKADIPFGVYASEVEAGGVRYHGMTNVGAHPTLPKGGITVETHLIDQHIDLYGEEITVTLLKFLREEKRFDSVEELAKALSDDKKHVIEWFERMPADL